MDGFTFAPTRIRTRAALIGVASGAGGPDEDAALGPVHLKDTGLLRHLEIEGMSAHWRAVVRASDPSAPVGDRVAEVCAELARQVHGAMTDGDHPVVIGGDHSCAIGTWSGAYQALKNDGPMGLVWVDAHMDAHVPESSHTGNIHGMPLAVLKGFGEDRLTALARPGPALKPEYMCLVGVRSYEPEEAAFLERMGVRIIFMEEVRARGLTSCLGEARDIAGAAAAGFGVSVDLDVLDPSEAPGVTCDEPGGVGAGDLLEALDTLCAEPKLRAFELVELNPVRDRDGMTARIARDIVRTALNGLD